MPCGRRVGEHQGGRWFVAYLVGEHGLVEVVDKVAFLGIGPWTQALDHDQVLHARGVEAGDDRRKPRTQGVSHQGKRVPAQTICQQNKKRNDDDDDIDTTRHNNKGEK